MLLKSISVGVLLLLLVVVIFLNVFETDNKASELDDQEYCENVKSGTWPDFNKNYDVLCV